MGRLDKKIILVTGGSKGIGRELAGRIVAEGGTVVLVARQQEPLLRAVEELDATNARSFCADITAPGAAADIAAFVRTEFGRLDGLVNNAGYGWAAPLAELSDDIIDGLCAINIRAVLSMTREALPLLRVGGGSVVNISSVIGQTAVPGFSAYAASKAGTDQLTRALAVELAGDGIRVNAVSPGLTETETIQQAFRRDPKLLQYLLDHSPNGRLGEPGEIADPILWLLTDSASWVTGQVLQASGGILL